MSASNVLWQYQFIHKICNIYVQQKPSRSGANSANVNSRRAVLQLANCCLRQFFLYYRLKKKYRIKQTTGLNWKLRKLASRIVRAKMLTNTILNEFFGEGQDSQCGSFMLLGLSCFDGVTYGYYRRTICSRSPLSIFRKPELKCLELLSVKHCRRPWTLSFRD